MNLIFASQNKNKIAEIRAKLPQFNVLGLDPLEFPDELLETGNTLAENALQKAQQVHHQTKANCFADDTGLEVEALNGAPGVYSARYAGIHKSSEDNMQLLLDQLKGKSNRQARFKTVVALILEGEEFLFEGVCNGEITLEKRGEQGFGYDPIFQPAGYGITFGQMNMTVKGKLSHRAKAIDKLVEFLSHQTSR